MSGLGKFKKLYKEKKMNIKRGLIGIVGVVCFILGVVGFLMTIQITPGETFTDLLGNILVISWFMFSLIALFLMMIGTNNRLCAQIATASWLIMFICAAVTANIAPHNTNTLSSSQMFAASLLLFVMPALIAEDAKHGWD